MPNPGNRQENIKFTLSKVNEQHVMVEVQSCCAITLGGHYIDFVNSDSLHTDINITTTLQLLLPLHDLKNNTSAFFILIVVNPSQSISVTEANLSEYQSLHSYPLTALSLKVLAEQDTDKNNTDLFQLPVARIIIEENEIEPDEFYIPPCVSVSSHTRLLAFHAELENFFSKIELDAMQILQKILGKRQSNEMSAIVHKLCEHITIFTASHRSEIRSIGLYQPPVYLINIITSFARLLKNTFDIYAGNGKEELLNYFSEWCNINHHELEDCIVNFCDSGYNHYNVNGSIEKAASFMKLMSNLFITLSKLEYIGKRKEYALFVKEDSVSNEIPKKRWRPFLDNADNTTESNTIDTNKQFSEAEPVCLGASIPEVVTAGSEFTARFVTYIKSVEQEIQAKLQHMSCRSTTHLDVQQCRWQVGTNVRVKLYGNHLSVEAPDQEFSWNGEWNMLNFDVKVSLTAPSTITILKFDVYVGAFIVARLRFDLEIGAAVKKTTWKTIKGEPIATAFASYASQDRERVLDRVSEIKRLGIDVFMDCLSMHPGDEWKSTLEKEIKKRESFLLFWSSHAKQSDMVTWEWRTALAYKGISGIEPHPLCPVSEAAPPDELKQLHFEDVHMLVRDAAGKGKSGKQD